MNAAGVCERFRLLPTRPTVAANEASIVARVRSQVILSIRRGMVAWWTALRFPRFAYLPDLRELDHLSSLSTQEYRREVRSIGRGVARRGCLPVPGTPTSDLRCLSSVWSSVSISAIRCQGKKRLRPRPSPRFHADPNPRRYPGRRASVHHHLSRGAAARPSRSTAGSGRVSGPSTWVRFR